MDLWVVSRCIVISHISEENVKRFHPVTTMNNYVKSMENKTISEPDRIWNFLSSKKKSSPSAPPIMRLDNLVA